MAIAVNAPVTGAGIETKINNANSSYLLIILLCRVIFFSNLFPNSLYTRSEKLLSFSNQKVMGIIIILPKIAINNAKFRFNPDKYAIDKAPLPSIIGTPLNMNILI